MGNGSICVNSKDYINERKNTLQYPSHSKEEQKLFANKIISDYYNNTSPQNNIICPNFYNNSNFITINSRKWYNAAPKKNLDSYYNNNIYNFNPKEQSFESDIFHQENKLNNNSNNNIIFLPFGDKYEGDLFNNKPHGKGKYYSASGEIREGIFINGKFIFIY